MTRLFLSRRNNPGQQQESQNDANSEDTDLYKALYHDQNGNPIYIVKQQRAYFAIGISLVQVIILIGMMIQCKVAPISINPMLGPYPDAFSHWGGKNAYSILHDNQWWRMITPIFLHAGVIHIFFNVAVQIETGSFFEKEWGSAIWITIYLSSAIGGSILSTVAIPNTIGVGSSGAVCGLFGGKIAEFCCRLCMSKDSVQEKISHGVLMEQFGATMCTIILVTVFSFIPYIDWAAHLGGLGFGFCVGLIIFSLRIEEMRFRIIWCTFAVTLAIVGFGTCITYIVTESKKEISDQLSDVCAYYESYYRDYQCHCN